MSTTRKRPVLLVLLILIVTACVAAFALMWRPVIEPIESANITPPDDAAMLRGSQVAAAGMCVVCHTASDGPPNAGGHAMDTPFGTIFSTNITPDPEHGIGKWSFEAFNRAMRSGIDREGRHLYPAFPYTAFTHMSNEDMQALYGYLMAQPPVAHEPPKTELPFPFNMRPLMAGWNLLFLRKGDIAIEPDKSEQWNRGKYMAQALAHCSACHSPRNALGAEKKGEHYFSGGDAEGWHAHALNERSPAPVRWTEDALYAYLRTGYSQHHGPAGASMAPVVREGTSKITEADTRALAVYVASYMDAGKEEDRQAERIGQSDAQTARPSDDKAAALRSDAMATLRPPQSEGASLFNGACLACHNGGAGAPMFGTQPPLWLNSNLHADTPDNLIRFILDGVNSPAFPENGYMPAFRHSLDDRQVAELVRYLRTDMAKLPAWSNVGETVSQLRRASDGASGSGER
ncbi:MAG: c-type cytochrome [Comamonadaceae bacterium]|nr:MAG: c-type cytochrome [Comamonadaceae bacterium]